jgi:PAS domain S-box-containing protein
LHHDTLKEYTEMKKEIKIPAQKSTEILVVEDSITQATQIKHLLESHHHKVSMAKNGKQALDRLTEHKPALVISDIMMPEMNGYDLCKKIKSNKKTEDIPVILLTILADPEEIIEGLSCGADSFITKPYNEEHLLSNIAKFISGESRMDQKKVPFGVQILYKGEKRLIQAEQQNVINLMLSIYEGAIHQNEMLIQTQEELRLLNERLESLVEDRTKDLIAEIKLSTQIADKLKESEEKIRSIFSAAPVGIGLVVDRVFIEANDTFCKMTGYSRKELIGKSSELIYATREEYENDGTEKYRQISEKGIGSVETRLKCKNGKILNILLSSAPLDKDDLTKGVTFTALDITQRKLAEEELLKKDHQLSSIYDTVGDVIYHLAVEPGENYRFISVNRAFYTVTGLSEEMVVGKLVNKVIPEPSVKLVLGKYRQAIKEKSIIRWEEVSDYPNGRLTGDVSISPVFDEKGCCTNLVGSVHDITKRKRLEEALQKSQHLFQTLAKASPVGIFRTDPDGNTTYVNPKWSELSGLTLEEAAGSKWLDAVHPDDREKLKESWMSDISSQKKSNAEYRFLRPDGSIAWVMENAIPEWIDNEIAGYIGTITDITGRKQMEETLRASEEKYRLLIDTANESIIVAQDGLLKFVNKMTIEMLEGNSEQELIGRPFPEFIHPDDEKMVVENYQLRISNEEVQQRYPFRVVTLTGIVKWVEINAVLIEWQGKPATLNFLSDISERKRAEEILRESEEKYRRIFENVQDIYYETSIEGIILEVSPSVELISKGQYKRDEVTGKSMNDFINDPKQGDVLMNVLQEHGFVSDLEIILKNRDGSLIPCSISSKILLDAQGHPEKIIGSMRDITDRKRADEALIESETKYRQLVTQSPDGIFIVDLSGKFLAVNTAICESLKYTGEELLSMKLLDIVPEKYHSLHKQRLLAIMNGGGTTSNAEYEVTGKDGINLFVEVLSVPYYKGDEIVGFQAIARDITERKRVEKLLRENEEKYRRIFENVQDLYYESSIDGTILEVSPSIESLSQGQYEREDLIGKSMYEFYTDPETRDSLLSALKEKGLVIDFEITLRNRDGSLIPCSISAKIFRDAQGRPEKIIGSMRDITGRKRAEEAIFNERRMLRTLIDNLPDHIYVKDAMARKVISNTADFKDFGFRSEDQVLGKTDLEIFPFPIGQRGHDAEMEVLSSGKPVIGREEDFIYQDGTKHWSLSTMIPLIDNAGKVSGLVGIGHDITERKHVVEELIKAKEKAEESDRLKTAFLHNISHEIRTPMNSIVGFSALLSEPVLDEKTQQTYIENIMESSNHLLAIINDIVDISNIEANLVKLTKSEIDLNKSLKSICNQFRPKADEKRITLECESRISDSDASVITDSTKLTQVISNLISNSLKFTNKGYIKVICDKQSDFLQFSVSDTGIGIPPEQYSKIFERFYQVQNSVSRIYEGTGLGLSISKAYVELMGGKMWLSSEPGKGSTFSFTIPYEKQISASLPFIEKTVRESSVFQQKKTILIAEDTDTNYKLITFFLSGPNITLIRACNGKEAVEKALLEKNIDLILMDIKMPEMDGYTAVRLIREAKITTPIIAQTAYGDDMVRAIESGCNGFISKPFDKKSLIKVLSEFI